MQRAHLGLTRSLAPSSMIRFLMRCKPNAENNRPGMLNVYLIDYRISANNLIVQCTLDPTEMMAEYGHWPTDQVSASPNVKRALTPIEPFSWTVADLITKHAWLALFTGTSQIWHNALGKTMPTMDSDVPRVGNLLFISYFYSVVTFCRYKFSYCWLRWIICYLTYIK